MALGNVLNYLAQTCSKHDNFIDLAHALEECIHARAFNHIYIVPLPFNLDGNHIVGLRY